MALESTGKRITLGLFLLIVLMFAFTLYTSSSYIAAPHLQQGTLTPQAYLPFVKREPTPTFTVSPADVRITYVENYDPNSPPFYVNKEYVLIQNLGGTAQNMDGWQLANQAQGGTTFYFPGTLSTFTLEPGASVKVWTRYGSDSTTELFWNQGKEVWDNAGDTAYLRNNTGTLVSTYSY